jgi:hypothetical protein
VTIPASSYLDKKIVDIKFYVDEAMAAAYYRRSTPDEYPARPGASLGTTLFAPAIARIGEQ